MFSSPHILHDWTYFAMQHLWVSKRMAAGGAQLGAYLLWDIGDLIRRHMGTWVEPIAGRFVGRPQFTLELVDDVTSPGGETSLMVSINFVSSLLWLPRLETFWRSLLFSNSMRWVSSFWELSLFFIQFQDKNKVRDLCLHVNNSSRDVSAVLTGSKPLHI